MSGFSRRRVLSLAATGLSGALFCQEARAQQAPARVPDSVGQLVVCVADTWNSSTGRMILFSRSAARQPWTQANATPVPVLFGRSGMAWGNGALPVPHGQPGIPSKREKDRRTPAGIFRIGTVYSDSTSPPPGIAIPFYRVTARDCWIDDPTRPDYNRHVTVDPANPPAWYAKERMRLGDYAYEFLLEIRHNSDPVVPGHGSAIFFHIRRGVDKPTAGCTTMARAELVRLLTWLRPGANPHCVMLPRAEYRARVSTWGLPALGKD